MKKKIAIILNSPYFGGAEKSIIIQASFLKEEVTYYVPFLLKKNECNQLIEFIKKKKDVNIEYFKYPNQLFAISRHSIFSHLLYNFNFLKMILELVKIFKTINLIIKKNDLLWCNGNKVGVLFYFVNQINMKKNFVWHFRDYPCTNFFFKFFWKFISVFNNSKVVFIANSKSVQKKIDEVFMYNVHSDYLYNPIGDIPIQKRVNLKKTIGIVSMMAPWKGIHNIIKWSTKYQKELEKNGIECINIYGGNLYQTKGDHLDYFDSLVKQRDRDSNTLIHFKGHTLAENIYNNIDLLIHSSIEKEPFGRVIVEAASFNLPVISTSLGGAGEICKIIGANSYDFRDDYALLNSVLRLCNNNSTFKYKFDFKRWDIDIRCKTNMILYKVLKL